MSDPEKVPYLVSMPGRSFFMRITEHYADLERAIKLYRAYLKQRWFQFTI